MRKDILILFVLVLSLTVFIGCSGNGEKTYSDKELIEIGQKQWQEDYYGDNREVAPEQAKKLAKRASVYKDMRYIFTAEQQYLAENSCYTSDFSELKIRKPENPYYNIVVQVQDPRRLLITATGNIDEDDNREYIQMNSMGDIEIVRDDVRDWREDDNIMESPDRPIQKARDTEKKILNAYERRMSDVPDE